MKKIYKREAREIYKADETRKTEETKAGETEVIKIKARETEIIKIKTREI